ncbi:DUF302 domain-containing protein [bacterium]|nr:DUF302 domain-containing protein [bacterium]
MTMSDTKMELAYTLTSKKPFSQLVADLEDKVAEHKFRVLAVHDVQKTLAEKGLQREPLKIIEVCNAAFAHEALQKSVDVAMFMPCRYTVHTEGQKTIVTLARPNMIAMMMPGIGLEPLANEVETTLKKIMEEAV